MVHADHHSVTDPTRFSSSLGQITLAKRIRQKDDETKNNDKIKIFFVVLILVCTFLNHLAGGTAPSSSKEAGSLACMWQTTTMSELPASVGLGGQLRPAHADPRTAAVRMHDGAETGIGTLAQLAGRAALLMAPRAAAGCRGPSPRR